MTRSELHKLALATFASNATYPTEKMTLESEYDHEGNNPTEHVDEDYGEEPYGEPEEDWDHTLSEGHSVVVLRRARSSSRSPTAIPRVPAGPSSARSRPNDD
jgi:hypothetical protein